MTTKKFNFNVADTSVTVEAEQEGSARYMVRISLPGRAARTRIGYLTGSNRSWLAEFFGGRPSVPAKSAKEACLALASWAISQANSA